jgi:hypothetical protein
VIFPSVAAASWSSVETASRKLRGLLDQLQEGIPGGVGELVGLVEDVDLEAALDRLQDHVLPDLADVVDPALARRIHLDDVERGAGGDRPA